MSPITHFLTGWVFANCAKTDKSVPSSLWHRLLQTWMAWASFRSYSLAIPLTHYSGFRVITILCILSFLLW